MKREFHVGDKCRIRQWDDMQAEFGLNSYGNINCQFTFIKDMSSLCGRPFTVRTKTPSGSYYAKEDTDFGWSISADMLEYDTDVQAEEEQMAAPDIANFIQ